MQLNSLRLDSGGAYPEAGGSLNSRPVWSTYSEIQSSQGYTLRPYFFRERKERTERSLQIERHNTRKYNHSVKLEPRVDKNRKASNSSL